MLLLNSCGAGWVDPDSPHDVRTTTLMGGSEEYDLVYSDEFDVVRGPVSRCVVSTDMTVERGDERRGRRASFEGPGS